MAERFSQAPLDTDFAQMTAAQVLLVIAALREDTAVPATKDSPKVDKNLRRQPRLSRKALMQIAQQKGETVWDVRERK